MARKRVATRLARAVGWTLLALVVLAPAAARTPASTTGTAPAVNTPTPGAGSAVAGQGGQKKKPIENADLVCRKCGQTLSSKYSYLLPPVSPKLEFAREEPALGSAGRVLHFENSHAHKHGVATFSTVRNVAISGKGSMEDTYFPGYEWRPVTCNHCKTHVGWLFQRPNLPTPRAKPVPPPAPRRVLRGKRDLSALVGLCQTFPQGWWTYEWCHQTHVRQFHREPDGSVSADWSLGKFDSLGSRKFDVPLTDHTVAKRHPHFVHSFNGGQKCDETGKPRRTDVNFACCRKERGPHIESIEEVSICTYKMIVCVPQLCGVEADGEPAEPPAPGSKKKVVPTAAAAKRAAQASQAAAAAKAKGKETGKGKGQAKKTPWSEVKRFYGLLWDKVLLTDDEPLWWVDAVHPVTALSH